jgi:hypothetical protein
MNPAARWAFAARQAKKCPIDAGFTPADKIRIKLADTC